MKELVSSLKNEVNDEFVIRGKMQELYHDCFQSGGSQVFSMAPGRVNLIGDHTDYNDGFVLPMSIEHAVYMIIGSSISDKSRIYSTNFNEFYECSIQMGIFNDQGQNWSRYLYGILKELKKRNAISGEINAVIFGNVPLGAGLSSSAALEISFTMGLQKLYDFEMSPIEMAELCQLVEAKYAGVNCGIMDQFVSRVGKNNQALFLDCRDMSYEHVKVQHDDIQIVVADSRVKRELVSSVYNERARECKDAVKVLNRNGFRMASLRDAGIDDLHVIAEILQEHLVHRVRHVILENQRVTDSVAAIRKNEYSRFGEIMMESHHSLKDDYEVSCPEMDHLVSLANNMSHCLGSRMTGGGFGGSSVSLVYSDVVEDFIHQLKRNYKKAYGLDLRTYPIFETLETKADYLG